MSLTSRITLQTSGPLGPEDYLSTSLGVIFPDDVTNQHGDADNSIIYTSPHLPRPLLIDLADVEEEKERTLYSHFLWNSSLLLAELVERDTLGLGGGGGGGAAGLGEGVSFDIRGLRTLELGAGTALPSVMAALLGARQVAVTDYPAPRVMETLRKNVARNTQPELSPRASSDTAAVDPASVSVHGHSWGEFDDDDTSAPTETPPPPPRRAFDRVLAADCLWMPWQHDNLRRSIDHFLRDDDPAARCWVVAGFHSGRPKMRGFFDPAALAAANLEVDRIWESECDGAERAWDWDRDEDITVRKRWLVVGVLKRIRVVGGG